LSDTKLEDSEICDCIIENCQYKKFLTSQKSSLLFIKNKDILPDEYCIFHAPEEFKNKFSYNQNKIFKEMITKYIEYCTQKKKKINFSNSTFNIPFEINNLNVSGKKINFTKTVFLKYFRMDNLKCKDLILQDTEFHNGGGIKNRNAKNEYCENKVYIKNLIFRPYKLETDFVIDIGYNANEDGIIESLTGTIKNIKFENHKNGKGIIYFIGLNDNLDKADFKNMMLDNVSFQNCNLSCCYFLNAKVDETEFRNCTFPEREDELNSYLGKYLGLGSITFILLTVIIFFLGNFFILISIIMLLVIILIIFDVLFISIKKPKHIIVKDEDIKDNNKDISDKTWEALSETYRMLKENFSRNNYQRAGDFFYSQRLSELEYSSRTSNNGLYLVHYLINGFGETLMKPLMVFFLLISFFAFNYTPNEDFIATDQTPQFLLVENKDINKSISFYKNQVYFQSKLNDNNTTKKMQRKYIPNILKDDLMVYVRYSASQFISPFVSKNRTWFKTVSERASILNLIETILLYIFFGAFILAVKNRIKR
jgi:uncharacterized protein YjbI with pentapeptide repeats